MQNSTLAEISHRANLISVDLIKSLDHELKSLHARNRAKGYLQSGATIKESARIAKTIIQEYFSGLEKFARECPNGSDGSDGAIINAISSSTSSLISSIDEQLTATARLVGDADLVRHIKPDISEELTSSQEIFRSNLRAHWSKTHAAKTPISTGTIIYIAEVICFILALIFVVLWVQNPKENFEPYAALFGLGSGASELIRRRLAHSK